MAFDFTGGSNTTRLNATLGSTVPPSSGAFSVGCWCHMDTWVTGRTFIGTGTTVAALTGLQSGASTAQRFSLKVNCATTDMVVEVAAPATGAWICVVAVYNDSLTATNSLIYTGSLSSPMASQAHVVDTNGSGAVTGSTAGTIGKNAAASTAIDGRISQPFWVPWAMTAAEVEGFRLGNWTRLYRGGRPTLFLPTQFGAAGLYDYGVTPQNWTNTGSAAAAADPPNAAGWGPKGALRIGVLRGSKTEPKSLDGAFTPAGANQRTIKRSFGGAFT